MPDFTYLSSNISLESNKVRDFLRTAENFFAVLDRNKIFSEVQIRAAMEHVDRNRGKKVRDDATLLMLYLSGHSQIPKAYGAVGVTPGTRNFLIIHDSRNDLGRFLDAFKSLKENKSLSLPVDCPDKDTIVFGNMAKVELELTL
ncbi:hypothetical protein IX51_11545 [uncultured archaeon]|nr:hypothetical protein IX51_11545 [uncultured archaeon]